MGKRSGKGGPPIPINSSVCGELSLSLLIFNRTDMYATITSCKTWSNTFHQVIAKPCLHSFPALPPWQVGVHAARVGKRAITCVETERSGYVVCMRKRDSFMCGQRAKETYNMGGV